MSIDKPRVRTYRDLIVYQRSFKLAMDVFRFVNKFPKDEKYDLCDQMRRAARSIPLNIAEGWAKRRYENVFKRHLIDAVGSCEEMKVCFDIAAECEYIDENIHSDFTTNYNETGLMLSSLLDNWVTYK